MVGKGGELEGRGERRRGWREGGRRSRGWEEGGGERRRGKGGGGGGGWRVVAMIVKGDGWW